MSQPTNPPWWPARQLQRHPVHEVLTCGQRLNPPLFSHVVNFPRLEIPLHGQYHNQIESAGKIAKVALSGKKQLLEKLGVLARTSKTAAQRLAPKKASATRAAKKTKA